ncbi:MAG: ribosome recycling factor [Phycisphaerae bacterium]|nr:ribosome recycling factor [Phycisphaerae bacterium]
MNMQSTIAEHENGMKKAVEFLQHELRAVRTGRASSGLVENLSVEYYGSPTPLKQLATIAVPEPDAIVIKPFDPASLKDIEKAIRNSELNLAPLSDGKVVRLSIPALSGERRDQLANQVRQMGEKSKISIRNIRRDGNKSLDDAQKDKLITEDERDKGKKDIDNLTKKYTDRIDAIVKAKSDEIMLD